MLGFGVADASVFSLLQQPGPKKFKLSKIELIYKVKKFKVRPFTIQVLKTGKVEGLGSGFGVEASS